MHTFTSGAKSSEPGLRYDLLEPELLRRLCTRMAQGAASHGERNYRRGKDDPEFIRDRINHLIAHALKLLHGDHSEDHVGAIAAGANMLAFLLPDTATPESVAATPSDVTARRTYDDVRHDAGPCRCGRIYTHPGYCERTGQCGAAEHPHATQHAARHRWTAQAVLDELP